MNDTSWSDLIAAGDWPELLRSAGRTQDVDELRDLWFLIGEYAPVDQRTGLQRRVEALGRAAAKTAARVAKEAAVTSAQPATPPVPVAPAQRPTGRPTVSGTRFEVDDADELATFTTALRKLASERDVDEDQAAAALAAWHDAMQVKGEPLRFVTNPGRTGIAAYSWLVARHGAMVAPAALESLRVWELTRSRSMLRILSWVDLDNPPRPGQVLSESDVHAQYLAAAHSAVLGDGEPTHELDAADAMAWDQVVLTRCPGYVVLATPPDLASLPPHAALAFADVRDGWILPTPMAAYLVRDHGVMLDIAAAVIWHERPDPRTGRMAKASGPRLARWVKLIGGGRDQLGAQADAGDAAAARALKMAKAVYTVFLGGLLRSAQHNDTGTLRPDWFDQVVAQAGANLLRALDKAHAAGARSIGAMKDAVWWTGDEHSDPGGMEFSDRAGKWHWTRWAAVDDEIIAAHRTGRPGLLRNAIIKADKIRRAGQ